MDVHVGRLAAVALTWRNAPQTSGSTISTLPQISADVTHRRASGPTTIRSLARGRIDGKIAQGTPPAAVRWPIFTMARAVTSMCGVAALSVRSSVSTAAAW